MAKRKGTSKKSIKTHSDIKGIILIALGLILSISIYTDSIGYLSYISKKVFISLLGMWAFILPIYLFYIAIVYIRNKGEFVLTDKFITINVLILNSMIFVQTIFFNDYYDPSSLGNSLKAIIHSANYFNSGILGYLITYPIHKLIGSIGTYIMLIAIYIICFMIICEVTVADIFYTIKGTKIKKSKSKDVGDRTEIISHFVNINDEDNKALESNDEKEDIKILGFAKDTEKTYISPKEEKVKKEDTLTKEIEIIDYKNTKKQVSNEKLQDSLSKELEKNIQKNNLEENYINPSLDLLNNNDNLKLGKDDKKELLSSANKLEETLNNFGVEAKITQVTKGPSVTRYELQPSPGVKVSKIVNLADDIALNLAANGVRIEAPIPGKSAIGIEVPNKSLSPVFLKEVIEDKEFVNSKKNLAFALGKDIGGKCVVSDLTKMPHLLIAGATGSGKSVCINTLILSIIYKYSPKEVKLLMVDPKVVELNVYNGIPHLLIPVVTDPKKAAAALNWAVNEMTRRYKLFADSGVRNIESYNALFEKGIIEEELPLIVIIVDELADLMMVCPHDVEDYIGRLAQMARAAGMHLVIATQRPSVDVITGVIKANIPSRISFAVSSQIDSRTILDSSGAEKLLGKGDMLFYPVGESKPLRIQGAFISEEEVERVVDFIKKSEEEVSYHDDIIEHIESEVTTGNSNLEEKDELLIEAMKIVVETGQASTSFLQRRLRIGFNRAARIMEELEENNIISAKDGSKPRQVLISKEELQNYL